MPPKPKYTREQIIDAGVELVRKKGAEYLTAREMGKCLDTSSRPIFTAFRNMNGLKMAVIERCNGMFDSFCREEMTSGKYPEYKAIGMAYIRLANEEKNIFKLLFMRDRSNEHLGEDEDYQNVISLVQKQTGAGKSEAENLHFEMWVWVHGIASMLATGYLELDIETISTMLTEVYQGLKKEKTV